MAGQLYVWNVIFGRGVGVGGGLGFGVVRAEHASIKYKKTNNYNKLHLYLYNMKIEFSFHNNLITYIYQLLNISLNILSYNTPACYI